VGLYRRQTSGGVPMNRKELVDLILDGTSLVRAFIAEADASSKVPSSYEDWNDRDVVGHIVGWMEYSIDKLTSIKLGTKQSEEYAQVSSLDEINRILYEKSKGKSRDEIETKYLTAIAGYIKVVSLFSNDDLNLDTFDTGFKMELWRYMLLDTVIHPVQHLLYQDLKKCEYKKMSDAIIASGAIFDAYSEGKKAYRLSEFGIGRPEYQARLKEIEAQYHSDKAVMDFVRNNKMDGE
jgi:hypothetical protein